MPGPMPPQGAPAGAQAAPPPPAQGQGSPPTTAAEAVSNIQAGLQTLQKMFKGAGNAVTPQDNQLLSQMMGLFQQLVQSLSQPSNAPPSPQGAQSSQPMAQNAGAGSQPMPPGY